MELYRSGHNGAHSKCVSPPGHVGSNPTVSAHKKPVICQNRLSSFSFRKMCKKRVYFPEKCVMPPAESAWSYHNAPDHAGRCSSSNPWSVCHFSRNTWDSRGSAPSGTWGSSRTGSWSLQVPCDRGNIYNLYSQKNDRNFPFATLTSFHNLQSLRIGANLRVKQRTSSRKSLCSEWLEVLFIL